MKLRNSKIGFTLIEVMISIVVFITGIIGSFTYFYYSKNYLDFTIKRKIATELCHYRLEEIRSAPYSEIINFKESQTPIMIGNLNGVRTTEIEDVDENNDGKTDYKKISVSIKWNQNDKEQKVEILALISSYL